MFFFSILLPIPGIRYDGGCDVNDPKKHLTKATYDDLLARLSADVPGSDRERAYLRKKLGDFTKEAHHFSSEKEIRCRSSLSPFYHEMGRHSQSAMGFLQVTSEEDNGFMEKIAKGDFGAIREKPDILFRLKNISPILHGVYSCLKTNNEEVLFNKVVKAIYNIYMDCFRDGVQWWETDQEVVPETHEQYIISGRRKLRDLPKYLGPNDVKTCKKNAYNTSNFTGTFFLACDHGFYNTSVLMQCKESPMYLFYVLFSFFKTIPKNVIYDNACSFGEYLANREPNFWRTGRVCVDKMHIRNHTGCSRGFNSCLYPDLERVNTQVCEQLNSQIKKLSTMVAYSKPKTAWQIITTYMCLRNYSRSTSP